MSVFFTVKPHARTPGKYVVEISMDGEVCAVMYATAQGIKIVSAHVPDGVHVVTNEGTTVPIPEYHLSFKPEPYTFEDGKLKRMPKETKGG